MRLRNLEPLFRPASVAVVGASEKSGPGLQVIENLRTLGYEGDIYPVNPKYETVQGLACFPSLTALKDAGHSVDMVAVLLANRNVVPIMEEAASIGAKAGWAFAAGFGESGEEGQELEKQLRDVCLNNDMLFLGPNCVGYFNPNDKTGAYSAPLPEKIEAGNIGMVAQSGYLGLAVANSNRGLGFSLLCTTGNEVVVDATDCIAYMLEDEGTEVVLAFIEQFRDPQKLFEVAARARELGKPIVLIKVGKSALAQRATIAHTGALAGSDDVQNALFEKLGIIRVNDFDEMFETAELLSKVRKRLPQGNRAFAITLSGGVISLMGDLSEPLDITFPSWSQEGVRELRQVLPEFSGIANPLDAWGSGRIEETYDKCLEAVANESEGDLVLVVQDVPAGMAPRQVEQYKVVAEAAVDTARRIDKPLVVMSNHSSGFNDEIRAIMREGHVPLLQGTREGLIAIDNTMRYAEFLRKPLRDFKVEPNKEAHAMLPEGEAVLNEYESKQLLASYGIPTGAEQLCRSRDEAIEAAQKFGFPLVLKVVSRDIQHKTEAGVVRLKLQSQAEVEQAYDEVLANARNYNPEAHVQGVLCSKMVEEPVAEAIVGMISDPYFGPAVVFGLGGVMVEVVKDRALLIPPITREEARRAIDSTKGSKLLYGFRGKPKGDLEALVDTIVRTAEMTTDLASRLHELDINPLLILPEGEGVVAVDALVALQD